MTTVNSEIERREPLRVDAARMLIAAAILVCVLAISLVLDRASSSRIEPSSTSAGPSVTAARGTNQISTRGVSLTLKALRQMNESSTPGGS